MTHTTADLGESTLSRAAVRAIGAATFAVAATVTIVNAHDLTEILVVLGVLVPTTIAVYGFLLPRTLGRAAAGRISLLLGIVAAVLVVPAFWSGQSLVLGVAAVLLGLSGRNADRGSRLCVAGLLTGALAALGYAAWYLLDWLS